MPGVAHIDFETFSEVNLKRTGTCRMAEHPSTEVLCMGWALDGEEPEVWTPSDRPPRRLFEAIGDGYLVHAWNCEMEIPTWRVVCAGRMGWPRVPFSQWRDACAVALTLALPANLEDAGHALGLDVVKDPRGKHLINKLCKPRRPSKNNPATRWTPETAPQDFEDLYDYCAQDVRSERAVLRALPARDLDPIELEVWRMTVRLNLRGWSVDERAAKRIRALLKEYERRGHAEILELTDGAVERDTQRDRALAWLAERDVFLQNWTAATISESLKGKDLPNDARRMLELRRELGKASTKKYVAIRDRACDDGTVKNNLLYHGASTGRDAGRGLQVQNFPRASVAKKQDEIERVIALLYRDDALECARILFGGMPRMASLLLRPMLVATEGFELFAGDYAQIENRVVLWLAGCEYGMNLYRKGLDEYLAYYSRVYGIPYDEVTEDQRGHAKQTVLGCVFNMGAKAYVAQAARFGMTIAEEEAARRVAEYRETYWEVVELWKGIDAAAKRAVRERVETRYKHLWFRVEDDFLFMTLPSGRDLAYYKPLVEMKRTPWGALKPTITHMGIGKNKQWERQKATQGRLTENAVQATARDVMMWGALRLAKLGYTPVGRVHDEIVGERPEGEGSVEEFVGEMVNPPWLEGVPIKAEGWSGKRYRK